MPPADKSTTRQSSGGKGFFTRKLFGDRSSHDQDVPEVPSISGSSTTGSQYGSRSTTTSQHGSQSSRHSHQTSFTSSERPISRGTDPTGLGLAQQAGVLTSIPFDTTLQNTPQPKHVMSLPKRESNTRGPSPHHLDKGVTDYHQYPAIDTASITSHTQHPSGPRPLNGLSTASRTSEKTGPAPSISDKSQPPSSFSERWYGPNGSLKNPPPPSEIGQAWTSGQRTSFDQASLYSNTSPHRASSVISFPNESQASFPPSANYPQSISSQHSLRSGQQNVYGNFQNNSTFSFAPTEVNLSRPPDDRVVEQEFLAMMQKRGWQGLPEQARRQMDAYTVTKKWTLVHQDRLSEWQNTQHRIQSQRSTMGYDNRGQAGLLERSNEEGSPEWYVRRVMDNSITPKQLASLIVELRTQPLQWVMTFVNAQGQIALSNVLNKLNRRQGQGSAQITTADLDREYDIVKCLKTSLSNDFGKDDALDHPQIIVNLAGCLTSTRLPTRKLVSELLTYLCHGADGAGHLRVLQALDQLKAAQGENGRFDAWMRIVEVTIDGRGKMGSMVGASEEYRTGGVGVENLLMEYAVSTLIFVNMIVDAPERDLQLRCHLRAQLNGCGIQRIFTKMEGFQYEVIDKQIEKFRTNESIDYEDLLERDGSSNQDGEGDETIRDLNDPQQITEAILSKLQGTKEQDYFLSTMQHMLLIRDNQGEDRLRMFQLVDSMLSYVAMDRRLPDMDLKQSLNFTVQGLLDKLYTDSEARQAREEALESRQIADAAIAERDDVRAQVELGAGGLVAKLQKQLEEQQAVINLQNRKLDGVKAELAESQRLRAQDLQRNELETRELYLMLRDAQDATAAAATKDGKIIKDPIQMQGILDREKLMDRLEMTLERQKTQAKLEGKVWQMVNPSDELRDLREQMDGDDAPALSDIAEEVRAPSRQFGSTTRKSRMPQSEPTEEIMEIEDEPVVFEKPRLVEYSKPKVDKTIAKGYLNDIMAKVRRVGDSDDEDADGDGVTTGPSHPSFDSPKTPEEPTAIPPSPTKGTGAPIPPPPPLMPGFIDVVPPPAPPLPPLMPGFSGVPPPPPPPMPGLLAGGALPPPAPPMPGFSGGPPPPPPPPMPGFTDGPSPPPPPPPPGTPGHWAFVNGSAPPPAPPIPGAPPLPGAMTPYRSAQHNSYPQAPSTTYGVRPKKKLKALHWEKLDTPQVTMWATHTPTHEAKESKYLELSKNGILDEVERLFMAKEIKAIGKSVKKIGDKKQIISSDLMRNFHIALNKFSSTSVEDIVRMIIHCDAAVLENVVVMDFLQRSDLCDIPDNTAKLMAPYAADYKTGTAADRDQDPAELTREDQLYLHTAYELHHYWKSRMRALALTRTYEKDFDDLSVRLKQVVTVSDSLRDSVSLMNVLGLILDIGNYMNDTSKQATGFKLSTLARLGMVKDEKNESTFADIIERIVRVQYPQWESFTNEIAGVIPAQKINVEQLRQDARKYIDNIANVQMSLDSGNLSDPKRFHPQDRVSQVVQRAMKDARWKASQLQLFLDDMTKTYEEILVFYGEDAADENARRDFFAKLAVFLMEWRKSKEKNQALEEQKRKMEESMRRKQGGHGLMGPPKTAASQLVNGDGDTAMPPGGAMDTLLEKLRAAAPQVKDQRDRRRRARLKDRHQVRVASGQAMPDLPGSPPDETSRSENGLLSPPSELVDSSTAALDTASAGDGNGNGREDADADVDIADRAALMLQGLGDGIAVPSVDSTISMRRRRESSDIERERRRNRRKAAGTGGSEGVSEAIPEEPRSPMAAAGPTSEGAILSPQKKQSQVYVEGPLSEKIGEEDAGAITPPETETEKETGVPITIVVPPSPRQP